MTRISLLVLIGLPGAGKTHLSRWLLQKHREIDCNILHLCYDDLLPLNYENMQENFYKAKRLEIRQLLEKICISLKKLHILTDDFQRYFHVAPIKNTDDYIIICDDNNYYRSMRYQVYQLSVKHQLGYAQIYIEANIENAVRQVEQRSVKTEQQQVPRHVIESMYEHLEKPKEKWESNSLTLHSCKDWSEKHLFPFLLNSLGSTVKAPAPPKQIVGNSMVHELDLLLRKRIKTLLLESEQIENKSLTAIRLNQKRKQILDEFRTVEAEDTNKYDFDTYVNSLNIPT